MLQLFVHHGVKSEAMGRTAQGGDDLCRVLGAFSGISRERVTALGSWSLGGGATVSGSEDIGVVVARSEAARCFGSCWGVQASGSDGH